MKIHLLYLQIHLLYEYDIIIDLVSDSDVGLEGEDEVPDPEEMDIVALDDGYESDDGMSLRSVIEELEELLHRLKSSTSRLKSSTSRRCREAIDFEAEEFDFVDAQFGRESKRLRADGCLGPMNCGG